MWPHAKAPWPCQEEREGGEVVVVPMMRPRPEWGLTEHCRQWPLLVTDRGTALSSGRNADSSCQDEWYQEIDKRYYRCLYATKRISCSAQGEHGFPVAFRPMEGLSVSRPSQGFGLS